MYSALKAPFKAVDRMVGKLFSNKISSGLLYLVLILYAGTIAPKPPTMIANALDNIVVRIALMALIAYMGTRDITSALLLAIGLVVSMMALARYKTVGSVRSVVRDAVDIPQSLLNSSIDKVQDVLGDGVSLVKPLAGPLGDVVDTVAETLQSSVDFIQTTTNDVIDGAQDMLLGNDSSSENYASV